MIIEKHEVRWVRAAVVFLGDAYGSCSLANPPTLFNWRWDDHPLRLGRISELQLGCRDTQLICWIRV